MSGPYGIVSTGFKAKPLADIKADLEAAFRTVFGAGIDVSSSSNFGQIIGILSERYAELWLLGEALYAASWPDSAEGVSLDHVASFAGITRAEATFSKVTAILVGTLGTNVPLGTQFSVINAGQKFASDAAASLAAATAWAGSTTYSVGALRGNGGNLYLCTTGGISSSSGGPSGNGSAITDGSVVWRWIGTGAAFAQVACTAIETGAKPAFAYSLTVIETPVAGLNSVNNLNDHSTLGTATEDDTTLRIRREATIRKAGNASVEAIRAGLLALENVVDCFVFENDTEVTDVNGVPPHRVECVVDGGDDSEIASEIFKRKGAGIGTYGSTDIAVTDSQGESHTIAFSRPVDLNVYMTLDVVYDPATAPSNPADLETQIQDALVEYGDTNLRVGSNVVSSKFIPTLYTIAGVVELTDLPKIGTSPSPSADTTISVTNRQKARMDTSRIVVNLTPTTDL